MMCHDNYDAFRRHDAEQEKALKGLPRCEECGEPIQEEECYKIGDMLFCEECIDDMKVKTENYMR